MTKKAAVSTTVTKYVKKAIKKEAKANTEYKHWFAGLPFTPFEGGPLANISIDMNTPIIVGTGRTQRIGNVITLNHLQIRYCLRQISGLNAYSIARVMVVQIKQTLPSITVANLLELDVLGANTVYSVRNKDQMHVYNVLYDKVHKMVGFVPPSTANTDSSVQWQVANINLKKAQKKIQYNNLAPSTATNGIYLFVFSDAPGPVILGSPFFSCEYEMSYSDG